MNRPGDPRFHTLSVLVENKAGVLARVADLFARRGYNIVSLAVAPTSLDDRFSRISIVVDVESAPLEQIVKQLFKLVNVVEITQLHPQQSVQRELMIATVDTATAGRTRVVELVQIFEGKIIAVGQDRMTVSLEGSPSKIDDFEDLLRGYGLIEAQRTGHIALARIGGSVARVGIDPTEAQTPDQETS